MRQHYVTIVCGSVVAGLLAMATARAQDGQGSIVGWGSQVVGVDLSVGFVAVEADAVHSLGLKTDGSVVAWGSAAGHHVPEPNTGFVAIAVCRSHDVGVIDYAPGDLNGDGCVDQSDLGILLADWGCTGGDCDDDADTDQADLGILLAHWGQGC